MRIYILFIVADKKIISCFKIVKKYCIEKVKKIVSVIFLFDKMHYNYAVENNFLGAAVCRTVWLRRRLGCPSSNRDLGRRNRILFGGTGAGWVETEMTLYAVTMLII